MSVPKCHPPGPVLPSTMRFFVLTEYGYCKTWANFGKAPLAKWRIGVLLFLTRYRYAESSYIHEDNMLIDEE